MFIAGNKFEGDMMLTPDQISAALEQDSKNGNKFAAMKARHWKTNGKTDTIEYFIESSLSKLNLFNRIHQIMCWFLSHKESIFLLFIINPFRTEEKCFFEKN